MSINEALNILGLNSNFREKEDINNKYYKYNTEYNYNYNIKYDYDYINYKKIKYW